MTAVYGLGLILTLVLSGGVIAYIGDKIGMKIGRKRLSLFGLRPKYTSIVITIVTGILIAAASLAVLTIASADVRTALFHMKEIQTALATSEVRFNASQQRLFEVEQELAAQEAQVQSLAEEIQRKTLEYEELSHQLLEVVEQRDAAKVELESAQAEAAEMERQFADLQADYENMMTNFELIKTEYQEMNAAYTAIAQQYETALAQYNQARSDLAATEEELEETRRSLALEKQRLEDMKEINQLFQAKIDELRQTEEEMKTHMQALTQEYNLMVSLQNELIQEKQTELELIKSSNFVFQANEIILATVMEGSRDIEDMRQEIITFLNQANQIALRRGVMDKATSRAALVIENEHLQEVLHYLERAEGKHVIRALAASNTLPGEPVEVRLVYLPNTLIYKKGEIILSREIDLSAPGVNVEDEIAAMLSRINDIGISRGMITYADGTLGTALTGDEFMATLRQMRQHDSMIEVQAVARHDIWSAVGPLSIDLKVVPLDS